MKRTVILTGPLQRRTAAQYLQDAPAGYVMTLAPATRSTVQNAKLWAMLGDVSRQVVWYGKKLTPDDWKNVMTASLRKLAVVPNIDGSGFVALGMHTSTMGVREMAELLDLIDAFGSERGVQWTETETATA